MSGAPPGEEGRGNRLAHESSPYLRQHARNPVDWFPWGPDAFERAAAKDKPVFLSIGYSTCHWCHVMERESFEDPETAGLLNRAFVSIKVDREERPDIDAVYMEVCQALTGSGGWPLTILMTPDKKPFFAATYLPRTSRFGRMGLQELIPRIETFWNTRRGDLLASAESIVSAIRRDTGSVPDSSPGEDTLHEAFRQLSGAFDSRHGGFSTAPKFPMPHNIVFLLRYWRRTGNKQALAMADSTLTSMRRGGIYDQLGYGFHRYSVDREWRVPHFEKMLYDQALLTLAYLEAYQATGCPIFRRTAMEILEYVLRDMTSPDGGFFTAEDADSEGEEGLFYTWTLEEIRAALPEEEVGFVERVFGLRPDGNFHDEAGGGSSGRNILLLESSVPAGSGARPNPRLRRIRKRLLDIRERRERPFRDETILTDWNGLMIAALARAGRVLGNRRYTTAAARAAGFLLERRGGSGRVLFHRHDSESSSVPAFASDTAFLAWGLIELYQADFHTPHLAEALGLAEKMLAEFQEDGEGGLFQTSRTSEPLLTRKKPYADGAVPSPNSVALDVLLRLARMTGRTDLEERADSLARSASSLLARQPAALTHFLLGLDFSLGPTREMVFSGQKKATDTRALLKAARRSWLPDTVQLFLPSSREDPDITDLAPFTAGLPRGPGPAAVFVCRDFSCRRPIHDPREFEDSLKPESGTNT